MAVFNQLSLNHKQLDLFLKIRRKGRKEQELQYLFPSVYGCKAVTRNTKGQRKQSERQVFCLVRKQMTYA
jgi:hypothetical protein